ncbi:phytoene dehydrogenase-like protein [Natronospira proteinivora]|uniref:Pyridine nucleotide-disulfide oxidoreductase domain-containing protein 2 n=1 Tax=Natronospira proteinivora TaxID=1807133 RepID=A0ABT1GAI7_9GAMM|nr:NAD(P)/FAD-dependent oxidoreductase [Natronospira proteinivora]MCP1727323.1 phytoene dehydrogenase-like protein [Natronospira proteinivora]
MPKVNIDDVVIIGAGHNGLACACYLARAGLKVRVLERRSLVGGAAVTEEFHPGFRNSTASYTVSLLNPKVIRDLHLHEHGLKIVERPVNNFLPLENGDSLTAGPGADDTRREVARFSARDAEQLPAFEAMLDQAAGALKEMVLKTPPNVGGGMADLLAAIRDGRMLAKMPEAARRDLLSLFTRSARDILDQWFESEPIKALLGFDSIVGNYASPDTPGSAYVLLHHVFGEVNGKPGAWGHAIGGMGAITQAMAREAEALGVRIETQAPVKQVAVEQGRVKGVALEDGRFFPARRVAANVGPKLLYLEMMAPSDLPEDFRHRIEGFRCASGTFRMNVALSELPRFEARPDPGPHLSAGIVMAPSLAYMDQAWLDARREGIARRPVVEMLIPSTLDDSLAPAGRHVASLFCQHFAPEGPPGEGWNDATRQRAADAVIDTVNYFAPNFRDSILGQLALSPADLEQRFGLVGGDIFHGALQLDQLYSARPVLGHGDYRGPVAGLYHCGSGAHPGGGVTGAPGHNAAREIIRDHRRFWRRH